MTAAGRKSLEAQAEHGDGKACLALYEAYSKLTDDTTARAWLDRALDYNYPSAQFVEGVSKLREGALEEGLEYLELASFNGNPEARNVLGQYYLGNIVQMQPKEIDVQLGMQYLTAAGLAGCVSAQILLAKNFYHGTWTLRDNYLCRYWLEKAVTQGSLEASLMLDELNLVRNILN